MKVQKHIITLSGEVPFEIERGTLMQTTDGTFFRVTRRVSTNCIEVAPYRWYHRLWRHLARLPGWLLLWGALALLLALGGVLLPGWLGP